jgi:hypothetical protein
MAGRDWFSRSPLWPDLQPDDPAIQVKMKSSAVSCAMVTPLTVRVLMPL